MPRRTFPNRREFLKTSSLTSVLSAAAASGFFAGESASAARQSATQWGDLSGRFLFAGEPPVRDRLPVPADDEYASQFTLLEEDLIVDPQTKGVANVVVWLYVSRRDDPPAIHDSYASARRDEVVLGSTRTTIDPHVQTMQASQTLLLRNTDPIGDGFKIDFLANSPLNVLLPPKGDYQTVVPNEERLPVHVSCPIHPWESGWLLVRSNPYMAVSAADGRFQIANLPAGKWTFQFWQEACGILQEVNMGGAAAIWRRGRMEMEIRPGANEMGDIRLAPELFAH